MRGEVVEAEDALSALPSTPDWTSRAGARLASHTKRAKESNMNAHPARAVGLAVAVAALIALAAPAPARADTVTQWNSHASTALLVTAGQDARLTVLHLAMVHGAVYDAVNAIDQGYEPYLISTRLASPFDSKEAAAATAAYRVLLSIVPAQASTLAAHYAASLAPIPETTSKTRGIVVGEAAAAAMIAARTADGRFGAPLFAFGPGAGVWRPVFPNFGNDLLAWLKDVKPFLIRSSSQFRSDGPYRLTSRKYAKEFAQVKSLGAAGSTTRTDDQTHAALYWAENPPRTWNRIFNTLSTQAGLTLTENARFFSNLYLTAADAFISVWDDKAHHSFWRPIAAIREADTDGNPATTPDTGWLPLVSPNPPYPEHPSGHTGFSGSVVETLRDFFGTDKVVLSDTTIGPPARTRSWTRFSQMIDEIVAARMWSGIHFLNGDEQGAEMGEDIAQYREKHYFQPVHQDDGEDEDDEEDEDEEEEDDD
jgi:hypothetical protein